MSKEYIFFIIIRCLSENISILLCIIWGSAIKFIIQLKQLYYSLYNSSYKRITRKITTFSKEPQRHLLIVAYCIGNPDKHHSLNIFLHYGFVIELSTSMSFHLYNLHLPLTFSRISSSRFIKVWVSVKIAHKYPKRVISFPVSWDVQQYHADRN